MAKAFTEQERIEIQEKIMEIALELFHEKGAKSLSIQELTKRVGIAQGSFYNFWDGKESLIIDLMAYRSIQKLNELEKEFSNSISNPVQFLTDIIYQYSMDLMMKIDTQEIYKDAFKIFASKDKGSVRKIEILYRQFLEKLIIYWKKNHVVKAIDERGLENAFIGSFVLCSNFYQFDKEYFGETLKIYIYNVVNRYIEV